MIIKSREFERPTAGVDIVVVSDDELWKKRQLSVAHDIAFINWKSLFHRNEYIR